MAQLIYAQTQEGKQETVSVEALPDHCPVCHHGINPISTGLAHVVSYPFRREVLQLILRCPRANCQSFFIAYFFQDTHSSTYFVQFSLPDTLEDRTFSESIKTISPMFCQIYNEAHSAEQKGWKLIAGPGYRKALEFLVKDYLCRLKPNDSDKIKSMQLGACIATFVDNDKVKQMAQRAAWLGNDETHYVRKWEDHDLPDLKNLIELTVHWIEMEEMTKQVLTDMPEGKK